MQWFKHDTDANQDAKLQNVLLDYGIEGYGLYWYCIELIAGSISEDNLTFQLEHDARIIARNTGSTAQRVEEMMRYFVTLGLFEDDDGTISCMKLRTRLNKSMTSNPAIRKLITSDKIESKDYSGFIYFIHAKNGDVSKIKIGRSKNPHARLNDLKKRKDCLGFDLTLIHTMKSDDCVSLETEHHRRFKSENLVDEWFYPSENLISYLHNDLRVDYDLTTITQIRLDKKRLEENRKEKENVRPDGLTDSQIKEEMNTAFNAFWDCWKACKKKMGTYNNSTPKETRIKWDKHFSKAWWKKHTLDEFENEVNTIMGYADSIHNPDVEFCPAKNLGTASFFKNEGWKGE